MKTKILGKKLTLNKETISNLDNKELEGIKGGIVSYFIRSGCALCCDLSITTCKSTYESYILC
jgi:hypothetical protein